MASGLPPLHEILSLKVDDEKYLKLDAQDRRGKTFEAIRDLLMRESQDRPFLSRRMLDSSVDQVGVARCGRQPVAGNLKVANVDGRADHWPA